MIAESPPAIIYFDIERAAGRLDGPATTLTMGNKIVGNVDEHNVVHWNDNVTIDDLKNVLQSMFDSTRWQMNQMKEPTKEP